MNRRDIISIGIGAALTAALALGSAGNELLTRGTLNSPPPPPTATPRPFGLTPRPTSTALIPRSPTPTPYQIAEEPGPCTVSFTENSVTCKTAYYQKIKWAIGDTLIYIGDEVDVLAFEEKENYSSLFDFTSRVVFSTTILPNYFILVYPQWQRKFVFLVPEVTGRIGAGNQLNGIAQFNSQITLVHHKWRTTTSSYTATFYTVPVNSQGEWTLNVDGSIITHPLDYWQVRSTLGRVTFVNGVLTRRLIFPIVRRQQ